MHAHLADVTDHILVYAKDVAIFGGTRGFDTSMPEALLERFILAATDPGDLVLDPFAASGTTLAVADRMGWAWVGVELSREIVESFIAPRLAQIGTAYLMSEQPEGAAAIA